MIDAEFTAEREDAVRPEDAAALDLATPESPDAGAPDTVAVDDGSQDGASLDGGSTPPEDAEAPSPTAGMTSQPGGEELPPVVESDPTLETEGGFEFTDDLSLPGMGFNYDFAFYA